MFKIILNQSTTEAFTCGSEVSGYLVVNEWKHKFAEAQVQICLHGHVKILWEEHKKLEGSKSTQRLSYYTELNFLTLDSPVQRSQLKPNKEFPFRFILPEDKPLPSSHDGYVGAISYYIEALISVVAGSIGPVSVKAVVPFTETVDINSPAMLASTVQQKEECIYRWYSKNPSGSITVTVETPHTGYHLEESVPFTATVHNHTGSRIKMEAALVQTLSYHAQDACKVYPLVVAKYPETHMPTKTTSVWNPTGVRNRIPSFSITKKELVSSTCSEYVKVQHRLEVTASLPTNKTLKIEIPITIGNVPRTETSASAPTTASEEQEASASALPQEKVQLTPHQPPFQRDVGWCLDRPFDLSLNEQSVQLGNTLPPPEMNTAVPPTYDAAVANMRKRSIPNSPGSQTTTGLTTEAPPSYDAVVEKPSDYVTVSEKVVMMEESQPTPQQNTHLQERVSYGQEHLERREELPQQPLAMAQSSEPPRPQQMPQIPSPTEQRESEAVAQSYNWFLSLFGFLLLVGVFMMTFQAYDYYTNDNRLLSWIVFNITAALDGSSQPPELTKD